MTATIDEKIRAAYTAGYAEGLRDAQEERRAEAYHRAARRLRQGPPVEWPSNLVLLRPR